MRSPISLSIVIPAYNEEGQIKAVVEEHIDMASRLPASVSDWEIVCLDDASVDKTPALLAELSRANNRVRVLTHPTNEGIFVSFNDLCRAAHGSHIYMTAADGQWPATNLLPMLAKIEAGADFVVGVRTNRREVYDLKRRFVSFAFNFVAKLLFGLETVDAGSIKIGKTGIFRLPLVSRSPFAEVERMVKAQRLGYRIALVPIRFLPRSGGKASGAKLKNILSSLRDCLKVRFGGLNVSPLEEAQPTDETKMR